MMPSSQKNPNPTAARTVSLRFVLAAGLGGCDCSTYGIEGGADATAVDTEATTSTTTGPTSPEDTTPTGDSPTGNTGPIFTTTTPTSGTDTTNEATETTASGECDPQGDQPNAACRDPAAPYCSASNECVDCTKIDCNAVSAATPLCDADSKLCVACTADDASGCPANAPLCDPSSNTCVPCTAHEQCATGACNFAAGSCFETALHVDRGANCATADGTPDLPFCEIQDAVAAMDPTPTVILVKGSQTPYLKQVTVDFGQVVAIVRDGAGVVKLQVDQSDSLIVTNNAKLLLHQIQISKGQFFRGIVCDSASLWLDRVEVIDRKGIGIEGIDCTMQMRRSKIFYNLSGAVNFQGGDMRIENSYITVNGGSFSSVSGVSLTNGATMDATYVTLMDNNGEAGVGDSIDCLNAGEVKFRNSIIFGQEPATSVDCVNATSTTSVVDTISLEGPGNSYIETIDAAWFNDAANGDFSLTPGIPFEDVAVWKDGDPLTDFDGEPRPAVDGAPDYVGADVPN